MIRTTLFAAAALSTLLIGMPAMASGNPDCALAERYLALAEKASNELNQTEAVDLLEKAVGICPSFEANMRLGEISADIPDNAYAERAAVALNDAYQLAATPEDQARAVARYAQLLHETNHSQKALKYAYTARNLDPGNAEILALANRIGEAAKEITSEEIVRGFGELSLKPLALKVDTDAAPESGAGSNAPPRASINIPLQFEFGTTTLTASSRRNISVLAETLAQQLGGQKVLFVGHADVRGSETYNLNLSLARAQAIRNRVLDLQPALAGQISVAGKGETQPLSLGTEESDHQINRRLEIVAQ